MILLFKMEGCISERDRLDMVLMKKLMEDGTFSP